MTEQKTKYSDVELQEFKEIILKKIATAEEDLAMIKSTYMNDSNNGTDDTSPTFGEIYQRFKKCPVANRE